MIVAALFFLLALMIKFLTRSSSYDDDWFNGRAIAETVKSTAWRYMMRVPPFAGDDADDELTSELAALLNDSAGLRHAVRNLPGDAHQLTASMHTVHDLDFDGRRRVYVNRRLLEQAHWYRQRSAKHSRSAGRWFWVAIVCQVLAVLSALLALAAVAAHQGSDVITPVTRAMSLLASLAIAVTAWTQLSRDDELARSYAVSLQELLLIAGAAERAKTEEVFAAVVRDGEGAISARERCLGHQAHRAARIDRVRARRLVATASAPIARPAQPKGWLATLGVLAVMLGIVGVGFVAAAALSSVPDKPITVADGVQVVIPAQWSSSAAATTARPSS